MSCNAQTLKRTVLYTLDFNDEVNNGYCYSDVQDYIIENELLNKQFIVEPNDSDYKFASIVYDSNNKQQTLIFNGKRFQISFGHILGDFYDELPFINIKEPNGFAFRYKKGNDVYLNIYNEIFGPYDDAYLFNINSEIGFSYKLFDKWHENIKGEVTGPFIGGTPHTGIGNVIAKNNYAFFIIDKCNSFSECLYSVNINNNIIGPYPFYCTPEYWYLSGVPTSGITLSSDGSFYFYFCNNDSVFVNINNKQFGPFEHKPDVSIADSGLFMYSYLNTFKKLNKEMSYINVNNKIVGPFENIEAIKMFNNISFAYVYTTSFGKDETKKTDKFLTINENIFGPYDEIYNFNILGNNIFEFEYKIDDIKYVNLNGKIQKQDSLNKKTIPINTSIPICNVFQYIKGEGVISSTYKNHQLTYNKEIISDFSAETNNFNYTFKFNYVVIDGKKYGKSVPINAKWIEERKSFLWNSIEGKELVVYELQFAN